MERIQGPDFAMGYAREPGSAADEYFISSPGSVTEKLANFPKFVDRSSLGRFLVKNEIFTRVLKIPGSVVECGVNLGGGLFTWAQLSAILEPLNHRRHVVGFDTFEGFPSVSSVDVAGNNSRAVVGGVAGGAVADLEQARALYDADRFLGHVPKVHLVPGDFMVTAEQFLAANQHFVCSLLYLDFDIYAPTKHALELFMPRMPRGAVIAFDELNAAEWPGETMAVLETVGVSTLRMERLPFTSICWATID
jgi:hypothetical protein